MSLFDEQEEELKTYMPPPKPESQGAQLDMVWNALFNGAGVTRKMELRQIQVMRKLRWQDVKLNFVLVFLALLLACWGIQAFIP